MADFTDLITQAKKMQEKMKEAQELLKKIEVEGISGGNTVRIVMNGDGELKKITFDESTYKESKEILEEHMTKSDSVLLSARISTGIDLKGDKSRFQIIPKVPWLPQTTTKYEKGKFPRADKIFENDKDRFFIKSALQLVQYCGRSIRNKEDYARTYILDSSIYKMLEKNRESIPKWFLEAGN